MKTESLAKAYVLTHGVHFTPSALRFASQVNAKQQNAVYNLPAAEKSRTHKHDETITSPASRSEQRFNRPQELFFTGDDKYTVCTSAVAPVPGRECAVVDLCDDRLTLVTPSIPDIGRRLNRIEFVTRPSYYDKLTATGRSVQRWVSACGYDEMNIWPWHDCAISRTCSFCGINAVEKKAGRNLDLIHAVDMRREIDVDSYWLTVRDEVVSEILQAVDLAIDDDCYQDEIHLILISGNLADNQLDAQARIYADLANAITRRHPARFAEGAVAVTAPPSDLGLLRVMRENGIEVGVFNLEAFSPSAFESHCPGKCRIGRDRYLKTLEAGVDVFGWGKSWCNFVLGLESPTDLLAGCEYLASRGVTPGANVLHRDHGASLRLDPPTPETVVDFYRQLANICRRHEHRPYYCQLALRTSLANEAFAGRLD
ncbi:radical SAM protein [Schlesneria sp. DSM 10557]|uniref:radical SAM protein n=1 Tax=Schlesneria sp. DSM 10557 TaxID=3044399 RepID=UPI0035A0DAC1